MLIVNINKNKSKPCNGKPKTKILMTNSKPKANFVLPNWNPRLKISSKWCPNSKDTKTQTRWRWYKQTTINLCLTLYSGIQTADHLYTEWNAVPISHACLKKAFLYFSFVNSQVNTFWAIGSNFWKALRSRILKLGEIECHLNSM